MKRLSMIAWTRRSWNKSYGRVNLTPSFRRFSTPQQIWNSSKSNRTKTQTSSVLFRKETSSRGISESLKTPKRLLNRKPNGKNWSACRKRVLSRKLSYLKYAALMIISQKMLLEVLKWLNLMETTLG